MYLLVLPSVVLVKKSEKEVRRILTMDATLLPNELLQHVLFYTDGIAARTCLLWYVLSPDKRVRLSSISTAPLLEWALQEGCLSLKYNHISAQPEDNIDSILREIYHLLKYDQDTEEYRKTKHIRVPRWFCSDSVEKRGLYVSSIEKMAKESPYWKILLSYSCAFYGYSSLVSQNDLYTAGHHGGEVVRQQLFSAPTWEGRGNTLRYLKSMGCQWIFFSGSKKDQQCLQRKVENHDFCQTCMKKSTVKRVYSM